MAKIEELGYVEPLTRKTCDEDRPEISTGDAIIPRRVRRSFEDEFEFNQEQLRLWHIQFTNSDQWCS